MYSSLDAAAIPTRYSVVRKCSRFIAPMLDRETQLHNPRRIWVEPTSSERHNLGMVEVRGWLSCFKCAYSKEIASLLKHLTCRGSVHRT